MFNRESNLTDKVIALGKAAKKAFGDDPPLQRNIRLTLTVHTGMGNVISGDLDSYITGVCDGLMAANENALRGLHSDFSLPQNADIDPHKAIGLVDDENVIEITARKIASEESKPHYEVILEGE